MKIIGLKSTEFITKLPDLYCPNLEELYLEDCKNLIEVHESFGFLEKLKVWNFYSCSQLQILPSTLMLKSLECFEIERCPRLEKFPDIHPKMNCLKYLNLSYSDIRGLPSSLLYLTGLDQFRGARIIGFLCLTQLNLCGARINIELDSWMQPNYFPVLTFLYLSYTGIVTIPESISRFTTLQELYISDCKKLRELPRLPQSIRTVDAQNCDRLDTQSSSRLLNQVSLSFSLFLKVKL